MKQFPYVLFAFFMSEFGRAMYFVTVTWVLYGITGDAVFTGVLVGLGFLPGVFLNLFFGVLVDRFDRKSLTIIAVGVSAAAIAVLLVASAADTVGPVIIFAVHMTVQTAGSLFRPAIQALIAECFPKEELPQVFSRSASAAIIGGLAGAGAGGLLLAVLSLTGSLGLVTAAFSSAAGALFFLKSVTQKKPSAKKTVLRDLTDGFRYVNRNRFLLRLFVIMFTGQLVFHSSLGFLSVYTADYLMQPAAVYGFLDASLSAGGALAGLVGAWWWKTSKNRVAAYSLVLVFAGLLLTGFAPHMSVSFLGVFLIGLGTTWIRVLLQAVQQMATEPAFHGRMASLRMLGNQTSVAVSAPALGWIAGQGSANLVYPTLAVPVALCFVFAFVMSGKEDFTRYTKTAA
ncbi:MFS transporter [Alteribacter lacisalsi]|uniref:MFS transporter n=1 Tax=Alteribacter lacisalsi TaxID=2045244 RepID=A0A2W0H182_9BACI|nr:MFS transporter [Alteribacter lacisalsi]PYZ95553.1 MFS transporter [Alteribacter lacisalsi]